MNWTFVFKVVDINGFDIVNCLFRSFGKLLPSLRGLPQIISTFFILDNFVVQYYDYFFFSAQVNPQYCQN